MEHIQGQTEEEAQEAKAERYAQKVQDQEYRWGEPRGSNG